MIKNYQKLFNEDNVYCLILQGILLNFKKITNHSCKQNDLNVELIINVEKYKYTIYVIREINIKLNSDFI